jgi:DGQHR domain-containing protein
MKPYKIADLESLFRNAEIQLFNIENITFPIVDAEELARKGKKRGEATGGELDAFAAIHKIILLVEFTSGHGIQTYDFDNFVRKMEILNEKREYLQQLVDKINEKYQQEINMKKESRIIGLYVNPSLTSIQGDTLQKRLTKANKGLIYVWDCDTFEYFRVICNTIRKSASSELFSFFGISPEFVFDTRELENNTSKKPYEAIKIDKGVFGYPTYTFKIKPTLLLDRCYVLRNEGWKSDSFQRMVMPKKLGNIRNYIINTSNTSFANNVIISPSPEVPPETITEEYVEGKLHICLPNNFSTLCIIDGQHRLLAFTQDFYGEKDPKEKMNDIKLRSLANNSEIIVTLVKFIAKKDEILRKQATLFRDINSNQTKVKTDFIYNLLEIIDPSDARAIGNKILRYLNDLEGGVLKDKFELKSLPAYRGRLKRASIVKYGLRELVELENGLLFSIAPSEIKADSAKYVTFCGKKLDEYFQCIKEVFKRKYRKDVWGNWRKTGFMLLSTSSIIGFLRLYRHFLKSKKLSKKEMKVRLNSITTVNFRKTGYEYTSSQWPKLEEKMFKDIRTKFPDFGDENLIKRRRK